MRKNKVYKGFLVRPASPPPYRNPAGPAKNYERLHEMTAFHIVIRGASSHIYLT
jgi:hypothetical protein